MAANTLQGASRPIAIAYPCSASSSSAAAVAADGGACGLAAGSVATPTSLCPVVAFASVASQLSFRVIVHLAVFAGECKSEGCCATRSNTEITAQHGACSAQPRLHSALVVAQVLVHGAVHGGSLRDMRL